MGKDKTQLDEQTVVPLKIVYGMMVIFVLGLGPLITGVLWVNAVNLRLTRIEKHLGIKPIQEEAQVASASQAWAGVTRK